MKYGRVWAILALSIALVIVMGLFLSRSLATLRDGSAWVAHSERVRFQLAQFLQSMSDLGQGVTAYQITHDPRLFEPAEAAAARIDSQLQGLQVLVSEDAGQRPLLEELRALVRDREQETHEQRNRALRGDYAVLDAEIAAGGSRRVMDQTRLVIGKMQSEEKRLLDYHSEAARSAYKAVAIAVWGTSGIAVFLLVSLTLITLRDAERLRALQEELATTLREADRRKDVFLATLSHELRNPLAPIRSATRLLETPDLTPRDLERGRSIISRQVRHMAALLDDLLDISRITRGMLTLRIENVELRGLMEAAVETAQPSIIAKRHTLNIEWPEVPLRLDADPVRLTQVIANLLTNAAKYTPAGGLITLRARRETSQLVISVSDNGIGIAAPLLTKVFEMFSQIDAGQEHAEGGIGIGLALVKGFVELHGGHVEALSAGRDQGSEFIVRLPIAATADDELPAPTEPNPTAAFTPTTAPAPAPAPATATATASTPATARGRHVLVADDNRDGAEIMALLLQEHGYEVSVAHSGPDALAAAARTEPQIAILDIGMPGMSGYEVARRIRAADWGKQMLLIALTGWGQEEDKKKASAAGFDHHLIKPIDPDALEALMACGKSA